jgi:glucose dehydrogenase
MRSAWIMILAGGAMLPALWAQAGKAPIAAADWPMYNRDLAGTRFSPLSQINGGNVAKLIPA